MDFESLFKTTLSQFVKRIVRLILFTLVGCLLCCTIVLIPTVMGGLTRGTLRYVREGVEPEFAELWSFDDFLQTLLLMLLGGIAIAVGLLLLIIPGLVLMVWWMYALFFVVDRKMKNDAKIDELHRQIGQLKVENDFLSRKLGF